MDISEIRLLRGVSQQQIAEACGVTRQAVSVWETGQCLPTVDKLPPMSETLGIEVGKLVDILLNAWRAKEGTSNGEA